MTNDAHLTELKQIRKRLDKAVRLLEGIASLLVEVNRVTCGGEPEYQLSREENVEEPE